MQNSEELDLASLLNTVSSASKNAEDIRKAPAAVTVFTAEDIRRSGATTVPELLRLVPGVQVFRTGPGNETVTIRGAGGLTSHEVVVLIDGMPLNNPLDGSVDWGSLGVDLQDIHRIEVVRGPVSATYGAGAYTGVVSITTRWEGGGASGGIARAFVGADSDLRPAAGVSGRFAGTGKSMSWQVIGETRYDPTFSGNALGASPPLRNIGGVGHLQFNLSSDSKFVFEVAGALDQRSAVDQLVVEPDAQRNLSVRSVFRYEVSRLPGVLDTFGAWLRSSYRQVNQAGQGDEFSYGGSDAFQTQVGFDLSSHPLPPLTASVGANAGLTRVNAPFLDPDERAKFRPGYGFYASARLEPLKPLSFSAAVRGDISDITDRLEISDRLAAVYVTPYSTFRVSLASAYRSPTWIEAGAQVIDPRTGLVLLEGNPNLLSARIDSVGVAAIFDPNSQLTITPTVYTARMTNLIVADFASVVRKTFVNDDVEHDFLGEELEVHLRVSKSLSLLGTVAVLEGLAGNAATDRSGGFAQNSAVTAGLRAQGSLLEDRLTYGLTVNYSSPRAYSLESGIPPILLNTEVPTLVRLEVGLAYLLSPRFPVHVFFKGQTFLPHGVSDSPFPVAGQLGTSALIGLEYGQH